ncbi:unnamed protein product, partial [Musa acuminata var. zebrina]
MMLWTRRKYLTWQGMVIAPWWSKPYSSSASLSSRTKSGWLRYSTGTTNRCGCSPSPPTLIPIHPFRIPSSSSPLRLPCPAMILCGKCRCIPTHVYPEREKEQQRARSKAEPKSKPDRSEQGKIKRRGVAHSAVCSPFRRRITQ